MRRLIAFYNAQHGLKKEFLFNYDGIEEHCFFAEPITISTIRELNNIVGYEAEVKLGCVSQVTTFSGQALTTDTINITPKDRIQHKIDWNTKMISMIFNARQETYMEPTETFTVTLVGTKDKRDELVRMFNLHGSKPFTFLFDGQSYQVRFPDVIEITDKRSMNQIQGFESTFDLEVIKTPNDGTYEDEDFDGGSNIIVKRELSLEHWYQRGCMIDGVCYKNNLKKLQEYRITNCYAAFENAEDILEIPELDTSRCKDFSYMFKDSSVREVKGLDFTSATNAQEMFAYSNVEYIKSPLTFPKVTNASSMFYGAKGFRVIPFVKLPAATNIRYIFARSEVEGLAGLSVPSATSMSGLFHDSKVFDVPTIDLNNIRDLFQAFIYCGNIKTLRFINCNSLTSLTDTFAGCSMLSSVTGLNLTKVENDYRDLWTDALEGTFSRCVALRNLTVIEEILTSTEDLKNKYYSFMMNYGLLDGRYSNRFIEHLIIVNGQGRVIERYDRYGVGRNQFA